MTKAEMTKNQVILCKDCISAIRSHEGDSSVIVIDNYEGDEESEEYNNYKGDYETITVGTCYWCEDEMEDSELYVCEFR